MLHQRKVSIFNGGSSAYCVDGSSKDIESSLQYHPGETNLPLELSHAREEDSVYNRDHGAQTHSDKHSGTERSPLWGAKLGVHRDCDTASSNDGDLQNEGLTTISLACEHSQNSPLSSTSI